MYILFGMTYINSSTTTLELTIMFIHILCAQEHLPSMKEVPSTFLFVNGVEHEFKSIDLITAICGDLDSEIDLDSDGYVRNHALEYLNTMLDAGHENYDPDFYEVVSHAVRELM